MTAIGGYDWWSPLGSPTYTTSTSNSVQHNDGGWQLGSQVAAPQLVAEEIPEMWLRRRVGEVCWKPQ